MDKFINDICDHVYVLHINDHEKDKFTRTIANNNLDLKFSFFRGVNGNDKINEFNNYQSDTFNIDNTKLPRDVSKYLSNYKKSFQTIKRITKIGQLGHIYSHIKLIEDAICNNYKSIIILEPDIIFHKEFKHIDTTKKNYTDLFNNNDIVYLGSSQHEWRHPFIRTKKIKINKTKKFYSCCHSTGTFSVFLKSTVFNEYLKLLKLFVLPSDLNLTILQDRNYIKSVVLYPNIIISDVSESLITHSRNMKHYANKFKWDLSKYKITKIDKIADTIVIDKNYESCIIYADSKEIYSIIKKYAKTSFFNIICIDKYIRNNDPKKIVNLIKKMEQDAKFRITDIFVSNIDILNSNFKSRTHFFDNSYKLERYSNYRSNLQLYFSVNRSSEIIGSTINFDTFNLNTINLYDNDSISKDLLSFEPFMKKLEELLPFDIALPKYFIPYCVNLCILEKNNGYAQRTHNLLKNIPNIIVFTRNRTNKKLVDQIVDNVRYIIFPCNNNLYYLLLAYLFKKYRIELVICVSNHILSRDILAYCKNNSIRTLYEIRGMWHESAIAKYDYYQKDNIFYKDHFLLEKDTIIRANKLIIICEELQNYIEEKMMVCNKHMTIIENGVSQTNFKKEALNITNTEFKIGYFGSIIFYEGIDFLIEVIRKLSSDGHAVKLVLIGINYMLNDNNISKKNKIRLKKLFSYDFIQFIPQTTQMELDKYYNMIDIIILPRLNYDVCDIVLPLKPLETMIKKIPLLTSNVKPFERLSDFGTNFMTFEANNKGDLENTLLNIMNNGYDQSLLDNSYNFIIKNSLWKSKSDDYKKTIDNCTKKILVKIFITDLSNIDNIYNQYISQKYPFKEFKFIYDKKFKLKIEQYIQIKNIAFSTDADDVYDIIVPFIDKNYYGRSFIDFVIDNNSTNYVSNVFYNLETQLLEKVNNFEFRLKVQNIGASNKMILLDPKLFTPCIEHSELDSETIYNYKLINKIREVCDIKSMKDYQINITHTRSLKNNYKKRKIIGIFDTFTQNHFEKYFEVYNLRYDIEVTNIKQYEFFICESAWNGNNGQWKQKLSRYEHQTLDPKLKIFLKRCKRNNIPTIFWNKEDSINYDIFIKTARFFKIIFTSDVNCVPKYKTDCKNNNVYVMPFYIVPEIHNPYNRKLYYSKNKSFYAGSYYLKKNMDRSDKLMNLLDNVIKSDSDLIIFDRQSVIKAPHLNYFPPKYQKFIHKKISYVDLINNVHKENEIVVNIDSVKDSKTMISRRVFESIASKNLVFGEKSVGIKSMFPNIVFDDFSKIKSLSWIEKECAKQEGWRLVVNHHQITQRLNKIMKIIKAPLFDTSLKKICVVVISNRKNYYKNVLENFSRQEFANKELIYIFNGVSIDNTVQKDSVSTIDGCTITKYSVDKNKHLGFCLNFAIDNSSSEYIAKMDDDDYYGKYYLSDSYATATITSATLIGKKSYFMYESTEKNLYLRRYQYFKDNKLECFSDFVCGATFFINREKINEHNIRFDDTKSRGEDTDFLKRIKSKNLLIFADISFNYCYIRYDQNHNHTWNVNNKALLNDCKLIENSSSINYKLIDGKM